MAERTVGEGQDMTGVDCVKGASGKVIVDGRGIRDSWRECEGRLMDEESGWDYGMSAEVGEGLADCTGMAGGGSSAEEDGRAWGPGTVGAGGGGDAGH